MAFPTLQEGVPPTTVELQGATICLPKGRLHLIVDKSSYQFAYERPSGEYAT
ncbi:hypothetical protein I8752_29485 [Nostocaceae cyanobacterium CENA369]|uniref:Uncharacterized protein n=1 Tax=Dendronalium phyllosphericum CENA369 TaxID=1725256 RepID=A0A8J7IBR5_9NOST|nr:hypothetical protein [Dendronalium phyllosphericum]MBH8577043.1 hypothetical protein [Dendronalium phyllosphericum CENA369]